METIITTLERFISSISVPDILEDSHFEVFSNESFYIKIDPNMAYNEKLTSRVREALSHVAKVEEKKMFRGVAFMVDGKMCITVGDNEIMCRIDPEVHDKAIEKKGSRTMIMKGRPYIGYVLVTGEGMKTQKDFDYWIALALDFNPRAKASKKKPKKK